MWYPSKAPSFNQPLTVLRESREPVVLERECAAHYEDTDRAFTHVSGFAITALMVLKRVPKHSVTVAAYK